MAGRQGPAQGAQYGSGNEQRNYFAPVTQYVFAGGFDRLRDVVFDPVPLARDLDLARFTGREWLIGQIDGFIGGRPRGYVIIQAEAGVGKSTLAARLAGTRPWPCHFTRLPGGRSPEAARKSLAAQLIAAWDLEEWAPEGVLPAAASRPDWFSRLLEAAAHKRDQQQPDADRREQIVVVVDGLDEAEAEPGAGGRGLPLGLPESLPDGVFVVATSRFGIDRALHAVRNPADWLQIEVEGDGNLDDMRRFICDITSSDRGDVRLLRRLRDGGAEVDWFRVKLAQVCAGVWIYLRYVLDEIRDGIRNPRSIGDLPADLAGFYAEQVDRWRGGEDEAAQRLWEQVRLPVLGVLGAARAPLTVAELAGFAAVHAPGAVRAFIEETARAFLSRRDDDSSGVPSYALRHHSLRDLLTGHVPARPDLDSTARMLAAQVQAAHRQITSVLTPPGEPGERSWDTAGRYTRDHLAAHAAACGELDTLACDPGFLLAADPGAVLVQRAKLCASDSKRALAAFDLSLHNWTAATPTARLDTLAANAARVHATALTAACTVAGGEWPVRWAAWTGRGHRKLTGHWGRVTAVAIGRAGDRDVIVSGSDDATVRVWDAVTGSLVGAPLAGHHGPVTALAIGRARDGDVIVSGSADKTVRLWDPVTGASLAVHAGPVTALAIGRAGDRDVIVSGARDRTVRVRDALTGAPVGAPLAGHHGPVTALAIGRAGDRDVIVSGARGTTMRVWDAVTGAPVGAPLAGHHGPVAALAIGRAGDRDVIVSGSADMTVRVWDAVTGAPVGAPLAGHEHWVNAVAIGRAGDQDVIVSGARDGTVQVWDAVTGAPVGVPLTGHDRAVSAVAIGSAGDRDIIVSGSEDTTVRVWDAVTSDLGDTQLVGHEDCVSAVAIGSAGDRDIIVSGSADTTVRVWDAVTGSLVGAPLTGHHGPIAAVAVGRGGDRDVIVSSARDGTVRVWDAATGAPVGTPLTAHGGTVSAVAIGRAGDRDVIVSGAADTLRVWDAVTGAPLGAPLTAHGGPIAAVAVGRAGDRDVIVSGARDGTVRVWDAATGAPVGGPLAGHDGVVTAVAIGGAGDRDVIVSGAADTLRVWDAFTGAPVGAPLTAHGGTVSAVAIGRAGDRDVIVSGARDGTVQVWDAVTGAPVGVPLAGHDRWVNAVAIGRAGDRNIVVSGSDDRTVLVRHHRPHQQIRQGQLHTVVTVGHRI
jgi:WD40 repeat protein